MEPPLFLTAHRCRRTGRAAGVEEETAAGATEDGTTRPEASHQIDLSAAPMSSHAGTCGSTMLARFGEPHVRRSEPDTGSIVPGGDGVEAKFKINFSSSETLIGCESSCQRNGAA
ncbi:unnamed protein product [Lampetra planeri]